MSFSLNLRPRVWTPAPKELAENPRSGERNARPQADVRRQRRKPARLQSVTERGPGSAHRARPPRRAHAPPARPLTQGEPLSCSPSVLAAPPSEPGQLSAFRFRGRGGPAPRPHRPGPPGAPAAPGGRRDRASTACVTAAERRRRGDKSREASGDRGRRGSGSRRGRPAWTEMAARSCRQAATRPECRGLLAGGRISMNVITAGPSYYPPRGLLGEGCAASSQAGCACSSLPPPPQEQKADGCFPGRTQRCRQVPSHHRADKRRAPPEQAVTPTRPGPHGRAGLPGGGVTSHSVTRGCNSHSSTFWIGGARQVEFGDSGWDRTHHCGPRALKLRTARGHPRSTMKHTHSDPRTPRRGLHVRPEHRMTPGQLCTGHPGRKCCL